MQQRKGPRFVPTLTRTNAFSTSHRRDVYRSLRSALLTRFKGVSSVFPVRGGHTMIEHTTPQIPDDLRPYLDMIAERLLTGHAAVMIGAGFSKNAVPSRSGPRFPD